MLTKTALAQNSRFKFGWILLLIIAAMMTLGHFSLIFFLDEPTLFTGFTAFNLYSLVVLLIPFRRGEPWAWWITWILPLGLAIPAAGDPNIAYYYFGAAAVCILGLLLTRPEFFSNRK
jgi:hypothetical protein